MRTKTKYREIKSDIAPVEELSPADIPKVEIDGVEAEPTSMVSVEAPAGVEPVDAVAAAVEAATQADVAKHALLKQVEAIHQAEALQRQQQAAQLAAQQPTREDKLAMWKQQGLSDAEAKFLQANPELIELPQLTAFAANEAAKQGHGRGTEAHMEKTKAIFHEHLARMQEQAANPALQPTPAFFQPPPAKPSAAPNRSAFVSAPVSREVPSGGPRPEIEIDPRRVTLTTDELQIAQASGISPAEYARQKLRLKRELASGQRQQ